MSLKKTLAGAMPFAHLLSNGSRAARAEEDDERKQREGEADDDYAKRMEELDEKERAEEEERKKEEEARRAEEERQKAEDEGGDEGMEDGDEEEEASKKAARARERTRCARIIAHGIKIGAVRQAGVFAFDTKMSSKAAIAALNASSADGVSQRPSLASRMAATPVPNPGASSAAAAPTLAQQIVLAGKKRRGEA